MTTFIFWAHFIFWAVSLYICSRFSTSVFAFLKFLFCPLVEWILLLSRFTLSVSFRKKKVLQKGREFKYCTFVAILWKWQSLLKQLWRRNNSNTANNYSFSWKYINCPFKNKSILKSKLSSDSTIIATHIFAAMKIVTRYMLCKHQSNFVSVRLQHTIQRILKTMVWNNSKF